MDIFKDPPPQVLLIDLGGHDLGLITAKVLLIQAQDDFCFIGQSWPDGVVIWSSVIPQWAWRGAYNIRASDSASHNVNRELKKALEGSLAVYVPDPLIRAEILQLY